MHFCTLCMNMCPRCVRELTKCQKTQPSLFFSIPKSLKTAATDLIQTDTDLKLFWHQKQGAPPIWATLHLSGEWEVAWHGNSMVTWRSCLAPLLCRAAWSAAAHLPQNQPLQKQCWNTANRETWGMAKMHDLFGILNKKLHRHVLYRYGPTIYYSNIAW